MVRRWLKRGGLRWRNRVRFSGRHTWTAAITTNMGASVSTAWCVHDNGNSSITLLAFITRSTRRRACLCSLISTMALKIIRDVIWTQNLRYATLNRVDRAQ